MIVFNRLWATLRKRGITQYKLIRDYGISTGQLDRLRKNGTVSTYTLDVLCEILGCRIEDIAEYIPAGKGSCGDDEVSENDNNGEGRKN